MRKLVIIFSLLFSIQYSSAQTYVSMLDDTLVQWNYSTTIIPGCCCEYHESRACRFDGDTTINNLGYKKLLVYGYPYTFDWGCAWSWDHTIFHHEFVRESNKQVFHINQWGQEELIYDFNLGVGDTIPHGDNSSYNPTEFFIQSIDSVLINSVYRKRYNLYESAYQYSAWIIEGVGSNYGPFEPLGRPFEYVSYFHCYGVNDSTILYPSTVSYCSFSVGTDDINYDQPEVKVYPNPAVTNLTVEIDNELTGIQFQLYDAFGRLVNSMSLLDQINKVDVSTLSSGIYFYQLFDKKTAIKSGKLVIE
jgi:hypothetical protein